jgi:hypothetical protein
MQPNALVVMLGVTACKVMPSAWIAPLAVLLSYVQVHAPRAQTENTRRPVIRRAPIARSESSTSQLEPNASPVPKASLPNRLGRFRASIARLASFKAKKGTTNATCAPLVSPVSRVQLNAAIAALAGTVCQGPLLAWTARQAAPKMRVVSSHAIFARQGSMLLAAPLHAAIVRLDNTLPDTAARACSVCLAGTATQAELLASIVTKASTKHTLVWPAARSAPKVSTRGSRLRSARTAQSASTGRRAPPRTPSALTAGLESLH